MLVISSRTAIPESACEFLFSKSGGPGGQNVNKLNTRVTVRLDIAGSSFISPDEKQAILAKLCSRIDRNGFLAVESSRHRTQGMNRKDALDRLEKLLRGALKRTPKRVKTSIPRSAHVRRLDNKKKRSELKRSRRITGDEY